MLVICTKVQAEGDYSALFLKLVVKDNFKGMITFIIYKPLHSGEDNFTGRL